jgi:hypothetical protein
MIHALTFYTIPTCGLFGPAATFLKEIVWMLLFLFYQWANQGFKRFFDSLKEP